MTYKRKWKLKGVSLEGVARILNLNPLTLKRRLKELYGKQPSVMRVFTPFEVLFIAEYFGWGNRINDKMFERLFKIPLKELKGSEGAGAAEGRAALSNKKTKEVMV